MGLLLPDECLLRCYGFSVSGCFSLLKVHDCSCPGRSPIQNITINPSETPDEVSQLDPRLIIKAGSVKRNPSW